ncbi:MAG: CPBP family intramembrane metalloprotease [Chlorobi bacterium]|nr:CPBP family intramembrane metalloprotease [Chlorobiota bacterium]
MKKLKEELAKFFKIVSTLDKRVVIVLLSVAVLQTVSYYYTSRRFFRIHFYHSVFAGNENAALIEYLFWFVGDFVTFFVLGILIIKFLLKEKIRDYGLTFGDYRTGFYFTFIFLFVMIPILWVVSSYPAFTAKYPHLSSAKGDWGIFFIFEAGMLIYMFAWEFVWRGFMLFGLEKRFGYYAVLLQMIPFVILHNGKPEIETFSAILGGIALGALALRTRTFLYGVFVHFGIMFSIDLFSALRYRTDEFGVGVSAVVKIISNVF